MQKPNHRVMRTRGPHVLAFPVVPLPRAVYTECYASEGDTRPCISLK